MGKIGNMVAIITLGIMATLCLKGGIDCNKEYKWAQEECEVITGQIYDCGPVQSHTTTSTTRTKNGHRRTHKSTSYSQDIEIMYFYEDANYHKELDNVKTNSIGYEAGDYIKLYVERSNPDNFARYDSVGRGTFNFVVAGILYLVITIYSAIFFRSLAKGA